MELIVMDDHATVNPFKHQLEEGNATTLQRYSLEEIQPKFRMVNKALRLSFLSNTKVETYIVGHLVACEDLDNYDKNGKTGKKKPLTLLDDEGNEINCTLWGDFAQQLSDFLNTCGDHGRINLVLQLAMMMFWDGKFYDI
ncbi:replication protein A 70 kDa DNA-binding subunit B [Tanacetum coccineum]